ncbi:hypothetical protein AVEN_133748-1 [Araneus ventricosus]|uniref:Uncharacterized protein n=1 Tax=Araneus ventricosus TaxID=182803 RepID=A0A4Y2B7R8_ARAVE|nr:hypothetical protein AVEN_133748-1 [Araneus ventricosus]
MLNPNYKRQLPPPTNYKVPTTNGLSIDSVFDKVTSNFPTSAGWGGAPRIMDCTVFGPLSVITPAPIDLGIDTMGHFFILKPLPIK